VTNKLERFTQRARRVLSLAQEEAERMRHATLGQSTLLGLMREEGRRRWPGAARLGCRAAPRAEMVERLTGRPARPRPNRQQDRPGPWHQARARAGRSTRPAAWAITTSARAPAGSAWWRQNEGVAMDVLKKLGISASKFAAKPGACCKKNPVQSANRARRRLPRPQGAPKTPLVDHARHRPDRPGRGRQARPVIGRQMESSGVIQILARRTKNNPALIGEPGVGKTPSSRAWPSASSTAKPPSLAGAACASSSTSAALVAAPCTAASFEERLKRVIEGAQTASICSSTRSTCWWAPARPLVSGRGQHLNRPPYRAASCRSLAPPRSTSIASTSKAMPPRAALPAGDGDEPASKRPSTSCTGSSRLTKSTTSSPSRRGISLHFRLAVDQLLSVVAAGLPRH